MLTDYSSTRCPESCSECEHDGKCSVSVEAEVRAEAQEPVGMLYRFNGDSWHFTDDISGQFDLEPGTALETKSVFFSPQPPAQCQFVELCGEIVRIKKELAFAYKTVDHNFSQYQHANEELQRRPVISGMAETKIAALQSRASEQSAEIEKVAEAYENQVELHNLTLDKVMQQEQYINELLLFIEEALTVYPTLNSDIETYKENNKNAL